MTSVSEIVTNNILALLDKGCVPWRQPWKSNAGDVAINAWGKPYRGINVFLLAVAKMSAGYQSNTWLTFNQLAKQGGTVKGQKSTLVIFWKVGAPEVDTETGRSKRSFMLRYFSVFNLEQISDIVLTPAQQKIEQKRVVLGELAATDESLDEPEAIVASYFVRDDAPALFSGGNRAFYSSIQDQITTPYRVDFEGFEGFYSTLFHEMGHSTGHPSRLARKEKGQVNHFGDELYATEELVAELTSAFLCAESGIDNTVEQSAAYIANWRQKLSDDHNLIIKAAGQAQKAADFIMGIKKEDES